MKFKLHKILSMLLLLGLLLSIPTARPALAQSDTPVVRAVLFHSPACPHCVYVLENDLPPLYEKYGDQLHVIGVNTMESEGWYLYQKAVERFAIPDNRQGVPTLIVGDTVLVGGGEIEDEFPRIIEEGLAAGGIALPDLPELYELMPAEAADPATPEAVAAGPLELFKRDPVGNTLSVIVLLGMVASVGYIAADGRRVFRQPPQRGRRSRGTNNPGGSTSREWLVPLLALVGLGVAGYLAYVETLEVAAVCGPVGDCNTVQQSEYARLFGVLPIGVLGAVGYLGILAMCLWRRLQSSPRGRAIPSLILFGIAGFGTLFSIYLTFLEPFVIGATCAWCLTSAVIITVLLFLTARPGLQAMRVLST